MSAIKENENPPQYPNNVQRTVYELTINHAEERIKRIQDRNNELEKLFEQTKRDITSTDVKTADEIVQLNRLLSVELTKINDCQNAMNVINQNQLKEKKENDNVINSSKELYKNTQLKLLSKIKILNAKINALEDFKNKKPALEDKIKNGNELMMQREEELKKRLTQIDIKFKLDKEKLNKNLHTKLFELYKSWVSNKDKKQSVTVRRLIQENIAIRYELDQNISKMDNEQHYYLQSKSIMELSRNSEKHRRIDTMKSLAIMKIQNGLIEQLRKNLQQKKNDPSNSLLLTKNVFTDYNSLIDKLQFDILRCEVEIANLKNNLYNENFKVENAKNLKKRTEKKIKQFVNILYDVKYAIACALQIAHCSPNISSMTEVELISHLKNLVKNKYTQKNIYKHFA
ncbi:hypothetical protein PV328_003427 [Microctonus aethiopoides]|uniref:Cilia- and flagella-associated protein 157 n=1 Tax=Microctonus aethiopoides TaxID=144406 RepID=A0AA39KKH6_9HYME|nr:hypothetical protein PV328_003427 [Microctonus aethiopoides]